MMLLITVIESNMRSRSFQQYLLIFLYTEREGQTAKGPLNIIKKKSHIVRWGNIYSYTKKNKTHFHCVLH